MNGHEPRWDHDVAYGKQGELQTMNLLEWIARGNGRLETKIKRYLDFDFYVETECFSQRTRRYELSGINKTEAHAYLFHLADTGLAVFIPTRLLRLAICHPTVRRKEERDGLNPTRGALVNLAAILAAAKSEVSA